MVKTRPCKWPLHRHDQTWCCPAAVRGYALSVQSSLPHSTRSLPKRIQITLETQPYMTDEVAQPTPVEQRGFVHLNVPIERTERNEVGRAERERAKDQGDPSMKVFSIYVAKAEEHDKALVESWNADMDGILIFVSNISSCGSQYKRRL